MSAVIPRVAPKSCPGILAVFLISNGGIAGELAQANQEK